MVQQSPKAFRMAPLQRLKVKPIEDPAEQAALDELLRRAERVIANTRRSKGKNKKATDERNNSAS